MNKKQVIEIVPGMKVWTNFGYVQEYIVETTIYKNRHKSDVFGATTGCTFFGEHRRVKTELFPGDLGMEGYSYDDRPCVLFTSKEAATAAGDIYLVWLANNNNSHVVDYISKLK